MLLPPFGISNENAYAAALCPAVISCPLTQFSQHTSWLQCAPPSSLPPVLLPSVQLLWDGNIPMTPECAADSPGSLNAATACGNNTTERVSAAIEALVVIAYLIAYIVYQRRAFRDHLSLPYCKYRLSNLYIRVQVTATDYVFFGVDCMSQASIKACICSKADRNARRKHGPTSSCNQSAPHLCMLLPWFVMM